MTNKGSLSFSREEFANVLQMLLPLLKNELKIIRRCELLSVTAYSDKGRI